MTVATGARPRIGFSLPNRAVLFGLRPEELLAAAERAEACGQFDAVWVGDCLLAKPRPEAIVMLSAIAARTKRVKLGTICLASFPQRQPILLAIQWASLDLLSGGRTMLAVCLGGAASQGPEFAAELAAMGVRSVDRVPRMEEGIELLRKLWGPGPISHEGRFYSFKDVDPLPKPVQKRVPIMIAVNPPRGGDPAVEERALRRVARLADGWQVIGIDPKLFGERWARIREYAAEYGRADEVFDSSVHLMVKIGDDAARARREGVEFLERYYGEGNVSDAKLEHWLAYGPPSAVAEKIARLIEAGCTTPVLRFTSLDQLGQLERCVAEVLPLLEGVKVGA